MYVYVYVYVYVLVKADPCVNSLQLEHHVVFRHQSCPEELTSCHVTYIFLAIAYINFATEVFLYR